MSFCALALAVCTLEEGEILRLVREAADTMFRGTAKLAGSYAEGTAVAGVSDLDIWVSTPSPVSRGGRVEFRDFLVQELEDSDFRLESPCTIGRKAIRLALSKNRKARFLQAEILGSCFLKTPGLSTHRIWTGSYRGRGLRKHDHRLRL